MHSVRNVAAPSTPFDRVIWTAHECAGYLCQSYSQFIKRTQYLDGFPARCPIPGQPRWRAKSVTEWAIGSRTDHEPQAASPDS